MKTKKEQKIQSRDIGLEIGAIFGKHFLKAEHLHYGLWNNGMTIDISNLHKAQENYVKYLLSHIPAGVKSILDVGCGRGRVAKDLTDANYSVDCVSPNALFAKDTRDLLGDKSEVFECFYEQMQTNKRYDMILFCESFQYLDLQEVFKKSIEFLNPNGYILISDFFKKEVEGKCFVSGGHALKKFYNTISNYPFELIDDNDITGQTAPNIDIENLTFKEVIHPAVGLVDQFLTSRHPMVMKIIKWKYRTKAEKIDAKYFSGQRTGENFAKYKSYRLMVYKRTGSA